MIAGIDPDATTAEPHQSSCWQVTATYKAQPSPACMNARELQGKIKSGIEKHSSGAVMLGLRVRALLPEISCYVRKQDTWRA